MPTLSPSTPQSRLVTMNGRAYAWTPAGGLDPAVVVEVERYIQRQAWGFKAWGESVGLEIEDLVQEGFAGALKAAAKYSPDRGANFLTYASWWIKAAMREALGHRFIRTPEGKTHVWVGSLDAPLGGEGETDGPTLLDLNLELDLPREPSPLDLCVAAEQYDRLVAALPRLDPRTREVVLRHTGLDGRPAEAIQFIADDLGLSRQRVSQILERGTAELSLELAG